MSDVPKRKLAAAEYLAHELHADHRSEFYNGELYAMAGASRSHVAVRDVLDGEMYRQLDGTDCVAYHVDQRVKVDATGLYTYPDIVVTCGEPAYEDREFNTLINPIAIVEVLSPATENYDRGTKFTMYQQIPSLREYIIVFQDRPRVERHLRQDDGSWLMTPFDGLDSTLAFGTLPVRVTLSRLYRRVQFPESQPLRPLTPPPGVSGPE